MRRHTGKNTNRGICKVPGTISGSEDQVLQIWGKFPVFKDCKNLERQCPGGMEPI